MSAKHDLLALLEKHAANGWVCPTVAEMERRIGMSKNTQAKYLCRLRDEGAISWRLAGPKHRPVRVVTITATGARTAEPDYRRKLTPTMPTWTGSPVRRLEGEEFNARAAELLARDAEERRKREMA